MLLEDSLTLSSSNLLLLHLLRSPLLLLQLLHNLRLLTLLVVALGLLQLLLSSLLASQRLHHLVKRDQAKVELTRPHFALLRVLLLDVADEAALGRELLLAGDALEDWRHGLLFLRLVLTSNWHDVHLPLVLLASLLILTSNWHDIHLPLVLLASLLILNHDVFEIHTSASAVVLLRLGASASIATTTSSHIFILRLLQLLARCHLLLAGLLHGDLPVLSPHILVEVVRPAHRLLLSLLLRLLLVSRDFGGLIEVTNALLVILHISLGVEPLVALDDMVVCRVGGFKAAEEDMVLIKLMSLN